uniref:ChiA1-BD-binding domain protein n=1 Tax=Siphoviridae sp. ct2kB26 TaxID=2825317 RepID=A0A8S5P9X0_9CAUD|nr:MAG TPA: ChiA1-BD-binding domain protein [Siphoviridae sp. ct2kB26]
MIYRPWSSDSVAYAAGDRCLHGGVLYKCLQGHTSQETWTPEDAASLWAKVLIPDPTVIPEWQQPESTNPYMKGDKVTYQGKTWQSTVDNNVWTPGVYGWEVV